MEPDGSARRRDAENFCFGSITTLAIKARPAVGPASISRAAASRVSNTDNLGNVQWALAT